MTFDLETGGFIRISDILQISAIHGSKEFNIYVTPTQYISKGSSEVPKLTTVDGKLYYDGKPVVSISIQEAMLDFIAFLKKVQKPILVGHNIKSFDLVFLYNSLVKCDLWEEFQSTVSGFIDTLPVFKKEFPERGSYKQEVLMNDLMQETHSAHNALDDIKALQKLCELVKPALLKEIFIASIIINSVIVPGHKITLKLLEDKKAITKTMASKIAKSSLNYEHLKMAFERSGFDGLAAVFGEKVNGVARVTKHGKIIQKIFEHFTQLQR